MSLTRKFLRGNGWSVIYDRLAGMYRGIRNNAATDNDVTVYCQSENEAWDEVERIVKDEAEETG